MAYNKVVFDGTTLVDLTADTVDASVLLAGYTAHGKDGSAIVGTFDPLNMFYPVGSYYETSDTSFDPNTAWGGTWILETAGQVHVSAGTGYAVSGALTNASDGGSKDAIVPYHNHGFTQPAISSNTSGYTPLSANAALSYKTAGSGSAVTRLLTSTGGVSRDGLKATGGAVGYAGTNGNATNANMQPYIIVNRWHRTA